MWRGPGRAKASAPLAYASGSPAARLEQMVVKADWDDIFRDRPPRAEIASQRKFDDYKTLFAPQYGVKDGGLALPKGVIAGVSIEAFFRRLTEQAIGIDNFQTLPIPYRAVATDIETGRRLSSIAAASAVPCAQACLSREGWRRWKSTDGCWLTAASRTTCP